MTAAIPVADCINTFNAIRNVSRLSPSGRDFFCEKINFHDAHTILSQHQFPLDLSISFLLLCTLPLTKGVDEAAFRALQALAPRHATNRDFAFRFVQALERLLSDDTARMLACLPELLLFCIERLMIPHIEEPKVLACGLGIFQSLFVDHRTALSTPAPSTATATAAPAPERLLSCLQQLVQLCALPALGMIRDGLQRYAESHELVAVRCVTLAMALYYHYHADFERLGLSALVQKAAEFWPANPDLELPADSLKFLQRAAPEHLHRLGDIYLSTDPIPVMAEKLLVLRKDAPDLAPLIDLYMGGTAAQEFLDDPMAVLGLHENLPAVPDGGKVEIPPEVLQALMRQLNLAQVPAPSESTPQGFGCSCQHGHDSHDHCHH
eukprot:GAFH01002043.1.p1 GENE.GAFH01002043.1~~GAFH01002043.1.p1  ORF type:complete len:416 (+),score=45.10 GAFH01002043.1:110-1249(+)